MSEKTIAIRNVYVMMAYAFRSMRAAGTDHVGTESFDHLHDLFAEILVRGVGTQIKRGLHRDYRKHSDELATVRGRIDITRTASTRSTTRGRLVCEFDEYVSDTPHNQALKSVMILLIRHGEVATHRRESLRRLLPYMDTVTVVEPTAVWWNVLTYDRANAAYRLLLGVCELVVRGLLPTESPGRNKLTSWITDEAMSGLYERFLREYYALHHPELSPRASAVDWDFDRSSAFGTSLLPAMRTDVTLQRGNRMLIIDAKYYGRSLQVGRWGKETVHSNNLYQILTYTKNADINRDGTVRGLLLYARTEASSQPDLDVVIQGNRIGAQSLDLNQPWNHLRSQLEDVVGWLDD